MTKKLEIPKNADRKTVHRQIKEHIVNELGIPATDSGYPRQFAVLLQEYDNQTKSDDPDNETFSVDSDEVLSNIGLDYSKLPLEEIERFKDALKTAKSEQQVELIKNAFTREVLSFSF